MDYFFYPTVSTKALETCNDKWFACLQDIKLFINSPGGSVTAGMGIYDAMQVSKPFPACSCILSQINKGAADKSLISRMLTCSMQHAMLGFRPLLLSTKEGQSLNLHLGLNADVLPLWPQLCRADVQTYCFGLAASMGAFLLGAGAKGKRYSMPNARIMIHQPLGGASGQAVDIEIQAKEIMYHKANLNRIMSECTGQPIEKVPQKLPCLWLACNCTSQPRDGCI